MKKVVNTNIRHDGVLEIYVGNRILAEISDGIDEESFIKEILTEMGYIWNEDGTICRRGNKTKVKKITVGDDVFEVVDEIPLGYTIWPIGKNMVNGYLPLCRLKHIQPFDGAREIETDTLKAIKCPEAQTILKAAIRGFDTVEKMERYLSRKDNMRNKFTIEAVQAALPAMRNLKWETGGFYVRK